MHSGAVLLVEDDPDDVAVAVRAFGREGLEGVLFVQRDGEQALTALDGCTADSRPAVVFLDLGLPGIDGWEVLRRLRNDERTRDIPVVIVSASTSETDIRRAYRFGANSYVAKAADGTRPGRRLVTAARYWLELNRTVA